jgi:hypothetical protein
MADIFGPEGQGPSPEQMMNREDGDVLQGCVGRIGMTRRVLE